jgi:hypothetical protein
MVSVPGIEIPRDVPEHEGRGGVVVVTKKGRQSLSTVALHKVRLPAPSVGEGKPESPIVCPCIRGPWRSVSGCSS